MKIQALIRLAVLLSLAILALSTCHVDEPAKFHKTKNIIILVIDGPRYSESWGHPTHQYIPNMDAIAHEGVVCTRFYNEGTTNTVNGHASILTGFYDSLNNSGQDLPEYPSIFQYWLEKTGKSSSKAWVIASKDKLAVLANCREPSYNNRFNAFTDCGVNGLNTGYRHDTVTLSRVMNVLKTYKPNLLVVNFREPDVSGHANNWSAYLQGITDTDNYFRQVWDFIQSDPYYRNTTTLFVTNDHGRHLNNVADGFVSHGDGCDGCRHLNFFASGPDFRKNAVVNEYYEQRDITATVAELLGLEMPYSGGEVMKELFLEDQQ